MTAQLNGFRSVDEQLTNAIEIEFEHYHKQTKRIREELIRRLKMISGIKSYDSGLLVLKFLKQIADVTFDEVMIDIHQIDISQQPFRHE